MNDPKNIRTEDYTYPLPEEKIASYPLPERDSSKLLVYDHGSMTDTTFREITDYISNDQTVVFNDTKVIRARIMFRKETGATIEIFCLEPVHPHEHNVSFASYGPVRWKCLVGNLKRWKSGSLETTIGFNSRETNLRATLKSRIDDAFEIEFSWDDNGLTFAEVLEKVGHVPVPPYLGRKDEEIDRTRYQTVYSAFDGSVAAPTAGLHFTPEILRKLSQKGIETANITLHVGAGTFIPVKSDTISGHHMHSELINVNRSTIGKLKNGNILAVGTTSVRSIESLYWLGVHLHKAGSGSKHVPGINQWDPYEMQAMLSPDESLDVILDYMSKRDIDSIETSTRMIILPGYRFRFVRSLITNFHMPGSTLLLLVAALVGEKWKNIYSHALGNGYRFLSYGDSSLIIP